MGRSGTNTLFKHTKSKRISDDCKRVWEKIPPLERKNTRNDSARNTKPVEKKGGKQKETKIKYIINPPETLADEYPVKFDKLNIKKTYELLIKQQWTLPRAWDQTNTEYPQHGHLLENMTRREANATMQRYFSGTKHPAVPFECRDTLRWIFYSGLKIGKHKQDGEKANCVICAAHTGEEHIQDLRHCFIKCPRTKTLWNNLIEYWQEKTGEQLELSEKLCLFGDRTIRGKTKNPQLEEQWRFMHAIAVKTIWSTILLPGIPSLTET